ncbi:MAG: VWA domain-containing protein [Chloroflexales bacterium]|nr:VWA domain-containing protein [Chloroflexales bacterium]
MRRHSVLWLLFLLALPATALLAQGFAPVGAAPTLASLHCVYLPLVSVSGAGSALASAGTTAGCPAPPPASGNVQLRPEHYVTNASPQPIQYVVVLDQSGSMSANFKGQCDSGQGTPPDQSFPGEPARFWQCANGPLYDTDGDGVGDTAAPDSSRVTNTGTTYYWSNPNERRIGVAKRAIETLIRLTNMPGNIAYTTSRPSDQMALVWFTDIVQRNGNNEAFANGTPFSDNPSELIAKMWDRSTHSSGDNYRTSGGTNGAAGLYRASLILDAAPEGIVHSDGRAYTYRQVVLFVTDGISNQFFHESQSNLRVTQSDSSTYPSGHYCRALGSMVIESAECQTTRVGGIYTATLTIDGISQQVGLDRPVTQMVKVSRERLQAAGAEVFVISLSDLPVTGLMGGVASFPSYYRSAPTLVFNSDGMTNIDLIVKDIDAGLMASCRAVAAPRWVASMAPANRPDYQGLNFPTVGQVHLATATGALYSVPIIVSGPGGALSYSTAGVPAGTYSLSASLWYRGDDGVTRRYSFIDELDQMRASIMVALTDAEAEPPQLALRLIGDACEP